MISLILLLLTGCKGREPFIPDDTADDEDTPVAADPITCADPSLRSTLGPLERVLSVARDPDAEPVQPAAGSGLAVADLDGDGRLDLLIPNDGPDQLLIQGADGSFTDQTAALWPDSGDGLTIALSTVDLDGDGDADVFACREGAPNALFLNDGAGLLVDASAAWGVDKHLRNCFGATFGDIDGDGDLDMALANNDPCESSEAGEDCSAILAMPSAAVLWENTGGRFEDISDQVSQDALTRSLMSAISLIDLDGDSDLDLFVTNDDRMEVDFSIHNLAFTNDGTGHFTDISEPAGLAISMEGMGIGMGDLNGDGLPDLLVTGTRDLALLLSAGEWWYDADETMGMVPTEPSRWFAWGAELADLDNDGDLDAPILFGWLPPDVHDENPADQADALFLNEGERFTEVAAEWGWDDPGYGRGVAVVDLDGDGWLDLIKRELGGALTIDRARCGAAAWLSVALEQDGGNRDAVGAQIAVEVGGVWQRRWVWSGGSSFAVTLPPRVHFGLGDAEQVSQIVVTWPDGTEQSFEAAAARQHLTLSRDTP